MKIKRSAIDTIYKKEMSISLNNETENIILMVNHNFYKKRDQENHSIFLNIVNSDSNFSLTSKNDKILSLEVSSSSYKECESQVKNLIKTVEKKINIGMSESLQDKIKSLNEELKKEEAIKITVNEKYLPKKVIIPTKPSVHVSKRGDNTSNKNRLSFKDKFNQIPLVYLVRKLKEMDLIEVVGPEKNGEEDFYWVTLPNAAKASKISILSDRTIERGKVKKFMFCRDMNNGILTSTTAYGLLYKLQQNKVFGELSVFDVTQKIMKEYGGFKDLPTVDEKNEKLKMGDSGDYIDILHIEKPSRMPSVYNIPKKAQEYKDFLVNVRKIDEDIVTREFKNKSIITGVFAGCENYTEFGMGFFALTYLDQDDKEKMSSRTFEKFKLDQDNKIQKRHLKNIKIQGRSHIIRSDNPKSTVFTEAVIDNYSLENIFKISEQVNEKDYHYVGLTSVGNIIGWLENNLGVKLSFNHPKEGQKLELNVTDITKSVTPVDDQVKAKEKIFKSFEKENIHFIMNTKFPSIAQESEKSLAKLEKIMNEINPNLKINVIKFGKGEKIDYNNYSKGEDSTDFLIDNSNIDEFLKENNISTVGIENDLKVVITKETEVHTPVNKDNMDLVNEIRKRFVDLTNTESMTFAFDNDTAALSKIKHLVKFCELLNLESNVMIPTFEHKINDNNDILKTYKGLMEKGSNLEAKDLVENFVSQLNKNKNKLPNNFEEKYKISAEIDKRISKEKNKKKKKVSP
jgi:hypothetical protein